MSALAKFNSKTVWNGVPTQTVAVSTLVVGDAIYLGADLAPHRIRAIDKFPGGTVNLIGAPAALLTQVPAISLGVHAPTDTVRKVVLS